MWLLLLGLGLGLVKSTGAQESATVTLPPGVQAVWDLGKAARERTATREAICINGLWRWQPAGVESSVPPREAWGYYKVPAPWPGDEDYLRSNYQTLYRRPEWNTTKVQDLKSAWYERTITIPEDWKGRRIRVQLSYLNSYARLFVDGQAVGEIRFPAGEVDLSTAVQPGRTHRLTALVVALPLKAVMESYSDTNNARQREGTVERRGLCGDVWLVSEPAGARLGEIRVGASVREGVISVKAGVRDLEQGRRYTLRARLTGAGLEPIELTSPSFTSHEVTNGLAVLTAPWKPTRLWDLHTPENQYTAEVSLRDTENRALDVASPVRFGFREFWIEGRDFFLNGSRLYLSTVPLDNAQVGAAVATYAAARESFLRLKSFGINFVYTHNYGCEPGTHLSFEDILRAADDTGMLVALSQPHFSAYDWKSADADRTNGYARHAAFYAGVAGNHPSVVSYSMSHNATGYNEDMNPAMMDGKKDPRDQWAARNAALALRCEAIVRSLDPGRIVYHHASGDLSSIYSINFYPNFVPIQELDDWFEHWSRTGNKPMVLVEYGAPFGWDWTMYRGWFNGKREFGSAPVPWEYCLAEWNASFLGDAAYQISDREKRNLRWEAEQFRKERVWHRWDYPTPVGDRRLDELQPVQAAYTVANWRSFRTWGLSGNSPWEHDRFWKLREGFQPRRQELTVDWEQLQQPGYSPDYIDRTYARFDLAYDRSDWTPTPTAEALLRNNQPLLAWIGGQPKAFTARDHTFYAGETLRKQLIVINNSRVTVRGQAAWSADAGTSIRGTTELTIPTGEQTQLLLEVELPRGLPPGPYQLKASFTPRAGVPQEDSFRFDVVPRPVPSPSAARVAVFDPVGQTWAALASLGLKAERVSADADLAEFDLLLIGKGALTPTGPAPDLRRVRDGLKVVVFEQTAETLEKRLGFRVTAYGLRQAWPRVADSPLLAGLTAESLRDWRGASTLLPPTLEYTLSRRYNGAPAVRWCGLEVTRLWRCGNRGNVASVLIEKPHRGDFMPVVDGGYALQYSPLLEYREGRGLVLFCQMDVTGRTEADPAAETLFANIFRYVDGWRPAPPRTALYAGEPKGLEWLHASGVAASVFQGQFPGANQALIVARGGAPALTPAAAGVADWVKAGGAVLGIGLEQAESDVLLPGQVTIRATEHIAASFTSPGTNSLLRGLAAADVHNRDPRPLPLVVSGAATLGDGVLAATGNVVFMQMPPWDFETSPQRFNQRRTFGRASFATARLLGNLGITSATPLLERFQKPCAPAEAAPDTTAGRFLDGLYLTRATEWDDPYRFFRW